MPDYSNYINSPQAIGFQFADGFPDKIAGLPIPVYPTQRYLSALQIIKDRFPLENPVIYVPGHGQDISHCSAFENARKIFNLDPDAGSVYAMREATCGQAEIECHQGTVGNFQLPLKVDVCLAAGVRFSPEEFKYQDFLKAGGLILISSFLPWLDTVGTDLTFEGVTVTALDTFSKKRLKPQIIKEVKTERDLMHAGKIDGYADYGEVYKAVYELTRSTSNLIESYNHLRLKAAEDTLDAIRVGLLNQESVRVPSLVARSLWRIADVLTSEGRDLMKDILLKYIPLHLSRNLQSYELLPLPEKYPSGIRTSPNDLEVYRYAKAL